MGGEWLRTITEVSERRQDVAEAKISVPPPNPDPVGHRVDADRFNSAAATERSFDKPAAGRAIHAAGVNRDFGGLIVDFCEC